jgi:Resolvase, N terminal domain
MSKAKQAVGPAPRRPGTAATPTAYSYIRFSTPAQAEGDSLHRQIKLAEAYCRRRGWRLSKDSYRDLGVSARKGKNALVGRLGEFLRGSTPPTRTTPTCPRTPSPSGNGGTSAGCAGAAGPCRCLTAGAGRAYGPWWAPWLPTACRPNGSPRPAPGTQKAVDAALPTACPFLGKTGQAVGSHFRYRPRGYGVLAQGGVWHGGHSGKAYPPCGPQKCERARCSMPVGLPAGLARYAVFRGGFRRSRKGNLWRVWAGLTATVFRRPDGYAWCVAGPAGPRLVQ